MRRKRGRSSSVCPTSSASSTSDARASARGTAATTPEADELAAADLDEGPVAVALRVLRKRAEHRVHGMQPEHLTLVVKEGVTDENRSKVVAAIRKHA
jgi:hypothetical protein